MPAQGMPQFTYLITHPMTRTVLYLALLAVFSVASSCNDSTDEPITPEQSATTEDADESGDKQDNEVPDLVVRDYGPVNLVVELQDKKGHNLLDASTPGNLLGENIVLSYNNKKYTMIEDTQGRYYLPSWHGLLLSRNANGKACLRIGEFGGELSRAQCVLMVGKRSYSFLFSTEFDKTGKIVSRKFYIDGVLSAGDDTTHTYTITL